MLGLLVVVVAVAYITWIARRSTRRRAEGACIRCGRERGVPRGDAIDASVAGMCDACVGLTQRNHRAAFWFCIALVPIVLSAIVAGVISDLRAGFAFQWWYLLLAAVMIVLPLAMATFIRASSRSRT